MQVKKTLVAMQIVPDYVTVAAIPSVEEVAPVTVGAIVLEVVLAIAIQVAKVTAVVAVRTLAQIHVLAVVGTVATMLVKQPVICHVLEKRW